MTLVLALFLTAIILITGITFLVRPSKLRNAFLNVYRRDSKVSEPPKNTTNEIALKSAIFIISVALAYKFIWVSFNGIYEFILGNRELSYVAVLYSYAWIAYIVMGVFWSASIKIGWFFPVTGTIAGVISFLSVALLILPALLLTPQVILAIWFVKFHAFKDKESKSEPVQI